MPRDDLIDALRGFALFGILAVNIQCLVTGLSAPSLGILDATSTTADHAVVLLTGLLLEFKFYPIFSFCFGYGFAVQTRRWRASGIPAGSRFLRRMNAMLFMGILHGGLLWFGDILTRYAIGGYVLRRYIGCGPRRLLAALKWWLVLALALIVFSIVAGGVFGAGFPGETRGASLARSEALRAEGSQIILTYAQGGYIDATAQRIRDFSTVTAGFLMLIPHIMVIFLSGALAAQLGLLRHPERHRAFWIKMLRIGLCIGLPVNAIYAWQQWQASLHPWAASPATMATLTGEFAPVLSLALIAAFALHGASRPGRTIVRVLAPAGRLALTLYVGQSLAMALLLNGFGFGFGAHASPADLFAIATGIYLFQIAASHVMLRYGIPGPLETWWRRYTYASPKPAAGAQ